MKPVEGKDEHEQTSYYRQPERKENIRQEIASIPMGMLHVFDSEMAQIAV